MKHTLLVITCSLVTWAIQAQVSGTIFQDFNANGMKENTASFNEVGFGGVSITGYGADGTVYGPVLSAADGTYTLAGVNQPTRIEFTWSEAWLEAGVSGGTNVQFVNGASTNINLPVQDPGFYCHTMSPAMAIPCYLAGQSDGSFATEPTLVGFEYTSQGSAEDDHVYFATNQETGTIWGLAYDRLSETLYTAAVAKRHSGFGPQGPGGIYIYDYSNAASPTLLNAVDLSSAIPMLANPRTATSWDPPGSFDFDPEIFGLAAEMSFGDIDISADGSTLWVTNLSDRSLYAVSTSALLSGTVTPADVQQFNIGLDPGCPNGDYRPWAVKVHQGEVYVGVVCSGETTHLTDPAAARLELSAYVMRLDGGSFAVEYGPVDLTYDKGAAGAGIDPFRQQWNAWTDEWSDFRFSSDEGGYLQPILSDIEFDVDGSLILGFVSRDGFQHGDDNYGTGPAYTSAYELETGGDIIRICRINGMYVEENSDPACQTAGSGNNDGLNGGEFYFEDGQPGNPVHDDNIQGGLAFLAGKDEIAATQGNPLGSNSGGVVWHSNVNGEYIRGYRIYQGSSPNLDKGTGLGDIELFCDAAPVEIGNLVWNDLDGDGVQDPDEPGIPGVSVELYDPATMMVIATATTDANGNYIFSTAMGTSTGALVYGLNLDYGGNYQLRIVGAEGSGQQAPLSGLGVTSTDNDNTTNGNARDSDGSNANISVIDFTLGGPGANNHNYDFGFSMLPGSFDLAIRKTVSSTATIYRLGDPVSFDITVFNQGTINAFDIDVEDYFDPNELTFVGFSNTPTGFTSSTGDAWDFTIAELTAGTNATVTMNFTINSSFTGEEIINNAEIVDAATASGGPTAVDADSPLLSTNDGTTNELGSDNDINDDSNGSTDNPNDEDDYDPARIEICTAGCGDFPWDGN